MVVAQRPAQSALGGAVRYIALEVVIDTVLLAGWLLKRARRLLAGPNGTRPASPKLP